MATPGDFAQTLKQQADIVRIVGDYVKLKRAGAQNYAGLCPFHSEKTASFSVHATRQFYHCFGCGASGDVFSFVQKIENVTFPEAVRTVAQKLGVPLPKVSYSSPEEAREAKLRGALLEIHEVACNWFQEQLQRPEAAHAREYLHNRGLSEEILREFRIGYAPDSGFLLRDRLKGSFSEELLRASGLFSWKETEPRSADGAAEAAATQQGIGAIYAKFRSRVMFPICNESGRVIAFTGRTLATDERSGPKYLNSPETAIYSKSRVLFNLEKAKEPIRKIEYAILVEGQMDCIAVYAAGRKNVIASSGTAFTEAQAQLLGRFSRRIVVNFDPDTAGAVATERTLGTLVGEDFEIKVLTLQGGLDPDSYIRQRGRDAYDEALRSAPRYFDFLIERARAQFPVRSAEGKLKALNYLIPHLHRVSSRIARDELASEIAHKLAIDSAILRQELKQAAVARASRSIAAPPQAGITQAERILIRALASAGELNPELMADSGREGEEHEFDPLRQVHYVLDSERLHEGLGAERQIQTLLENPGSNAMELELAESGRRLLAECLLDENEELTPDLIHGAVGALRRRKLEADQRRVRHEILQAERKQDLEAIARLIREKVAIDRALAAEGSGGERRPA
jgi:DNA primase